MSKPNRLMLFRPYNLIFLIVLQIFTFYFLNFDSKLISLYDGRLLILVLCTVFIAGAGYMINDHYDRITDAINKPDNQPILGWRLNRFWIAYFGLNLLGLIGGAMLGVRWLVLFGVIILMLWLYSYKLKRLPLIGNLLISLFSFFSIYLVYDVFQTQSKMAVIFYASLAAFFTLLREIAKDIEDMEGDAATNQITFPVVAGFLPSKSFLASATVFATVVYASFQYRWVAPSFEGKLFLVFAGYQIICILLPMVYLIVLVVKSNRPSDMKRISKLFKYVMATGMLSMAFF
jgi:4-hydroxybenzoate polyprenyltransferase